MTRTSAVMALPLSLLLTLQLGACGDDDDAPKGDASTRDAGDAGDDETDDDGSDATADRADGGARDAGSRDSGNAAFAVSCDDYLACVCGDASARDDDSAECTAKRAVVEELRGDVGATASDAYCTQQILLTPDAAAGCDIDLPGASADACDALVLCECASLEAADGDSDRCKANRTTAEQFQQLDAGSGCATVLASLTCSAADGGLPADAGADPVDACVAANQAQAAAKSALDSAIAAELSSYNGCSLNSDCALATLKVTCEGRDEIVVAGRAIAASQQAGYASRALQLGAPYCNSLAVRPSGCASDSTDPAATARCTAGRCEKLLSAP